MSASRQSLGWREKVFRILRFFRQPSKKKSPANAIRPKAMNRARVENRIGALPIRLKRKDPPQKNFLLRESETACFDKKRIDTEEHHCKRKVHGTDKKRPFPR